jgi:hypothetical protein
MDIKISKASEKKNIKVNVGSISAMYFYNYIKQIMSEHNCN